VLTPEEDLPREPLADPELCGRFAAWFAAALGNRVDTDSALAAIEAGSDGHVVTGWPDWRIDADGNEGVELIARLPDIGTVAVEYALSDVVARLLSIGVNEVSLVLPVAGDPLGLTGVGQFSAAALEAECGVLLVTDLMRIGLIPTPDKRGSSYRGWRWQVLIEPLQSVDPLETAVLGQRLTPVSAFAPIGDLPAPEPLLVVEQADRALGRALRAATNDLAALDLAQWRPEVAAGRKEAEAALRAAGQRFPPGWPPPARALAERALMLWRIVRAARADAGAISASGSQARSQALSALSHAVREAAMVAYNVPLLAMPANRRTGAVEPDLR
jgi:hypothetical protein